MPASTCPSCTGPIPLVPLGEGFMCPGCHETFGPQNAVAVSSDAITLRGILGDLKDEVPRPASRPRSAAPPKNPFSADFLKNFEMVGFLGKGAMGSVFLMRQVNLDRLVAVKAVRSSGMTEKENKRLLKEARVIARLNHPAIRSIYDVGADREVPYMVCEYVDGETLADALKAQGPMPLTEALRSAMAILEGLEFAHKQGVVHRDLKPGNILLTREGRPKIVDFGLATVNSMSTVETLAGRILGTPRYMSPEQCEGNETTLASDIYAMGLVVFEMLTGRLPYDGPNPMNFMDQHIHARPKRVTEVRPDLPGELDPILDTALEKSPARRHASAAALSDQLMTIFSGLTAVRFTPTRPKWVQEAARNGPPSQDPAVATMMEGAAASLSTASLGAGATTWPASPQPVAPGVLLSGRFEMVRPLRATESGELWLALDSALEGSEVLVNVLSRALWSNAAAKANLVKEAKAAIKLSHPNVVRLMSLEPGPTPFMVVEHVEGLTLEEDVTRRVTQGAKPHSPEEALPLLEQMAEALEYAHARGMVHGDLKPSNVVLEVEGGAPCPRVGDFGIDAVVRALDHTKNAAADPYRAPELAAGRPADARTDVYALGGLLHLMLTSKPPAPAGDGDPSWPGTAGPRRELLPQAVANVVVQAMAREPEVRPATPGALVDRFRGALRTGAKVERKPGRATGMFRVADLKPVVPDKAQEAQKLTRLGLFQLVTDEVFKDGVVEDWENRALVALTEFLELGTEQARGVAWLSLEKFQLGRLGSKRPLDPRTLYSKALYFAYIDGSLSTEEAWMLEGLRKLFGLTDKDHEQLLERVRAKMQS